MGSNGHKEGMEAVDWGRGGGGENLAREKMK